MSETTPSPLPFPSDWTTWLPNTWSTYDFVGEPPPLPDVQLDGTFRWLTPLDPDVERKMQKYRPSKAYQDALVSKLANIQDRAHQLGLSLPDAFVLLMSSPDLQDRIPSATACFFSLPDDIVPCLEHEDDAFVIPFLRDQQDCCAWYLYINRRNETCVLVAGLELIEFLDPEIAAEISAEDRQDILDGTKVCSTSFETFIYRFWLENTIWFFDYLHKPLPDEWQRYLAVYREEQSEPGTW